jgi:hypothetical protein
MDEQAARFLKMTLPVGGHSHHSGTLSILLAVAMLCYSFSAFFGLILLFVIHSVIMSEPDLESQTINK